MNPLELATVNWYPPLPFGFTERVPIPGMGGVYDWRILLGLHLFRWPPRSTLQPFPVIGVLTCVITCCYDLPLRGWVKPPFPVSPCGE